MAEAFKHEEVAAFLKSRVAGRERTEPKEASVDERKRVVALLKGLPKGPWED